MPPRYPGGTQSADGGGGHAGRPADVRFLLVQAGIAIDPRAEPRHREWAEREIDEALRILPTPRQLADVLDLTRAR